MKAVVGERFRNTPPANSHFAECSRRWDRHTWLSIPKHAQSWTANIVALLQNTYPTCVSERRCNLRGTASTLRDGDLSCPAQRYQRKPVPSCDSVYVAKHTFFLCVRKRTNIGPTSSRSVTLAACSFGRRRFMAALHLRMISRVTGACRGWG